MTGARKLTAKIRPPLARGAPRRLPPVDESDPSRRRLVAVCALRGGLEHDRACREFVRDNLGLAVAYARELSPRHVPETDLVHACVIGLLRAIREFDPDRAGKFSTYAVWKMRHEANTLIRRQEGAIVPAPGSLVDDRRAVDEEIRRLSSLLGCPPDDATLLEALREREDAGADGLRAVAAREARESARRGGMSEEEAREVGEDAAEALVVPRRWAGAGEERVREVREAHVGFSHRALDPRKPSAGPSMETLLHVRRAFARLPPLLRAVLAEELDLDLPGSADVPVPDCPVTRRIALELARSRLRAFLEAR